MKSLLLILLLGLYSSTLIYENIPKNSYREMIKREIIDIQELNSLQSFAYPDYQVKTVKESNTNEKIEKVKPFLTVINPDMMTFEISETNDYKLSFTRKENELSCLIISFDCEVTNAASLTTPAKFSIVAKDYSFTKTYKQFPESNFFIPEAKAEFTLDITNVSVAKPEVVSIHSLAEMLNVYVKDITASLLAAYNKKGVSAYYLKGTLDKEIKHIYVNKGTGVGENTITLTPDKVPSIKENVVIQNYNGNINNLVDTEDPLTKESAEYFIAVNKKLLQSIINENLFSYQMEEANKPITAYSLTIQSAKEICAELQTEPLDKKFKILQTIMSVTIDQTNFPTGKAVIKTDLIADVDKKVLLSFNTEFAIKFDMIVFQRGINFRLRTHELAINAVTVNPDPKRVITNETVLKQWMLESFRMYLINNEYNLFDLSFNLKEYFPKLRSVDIEGNYLILQ